METTQNIAVTSKKLKQLCNKYHYELCRGLKPDYLPKIRIRYVEERGKFGYADFGDFFFFDDDLFVWRSEDKFAGDHSQDVVDGEFNEMCSRLEYACRFLYAGIDTNFTDCNGAHIFVGDVLPLLVGVGETACHFVDDLLLLLVELCHHHRAMLVGHRGYRQGE